MLLSISSRTAAHPRAGGENPHKVEFDVPTNGSSPRGRGKRVALGSCVGGVGLIPARAGKTTNARMTRASPRAHPRAGGENDGGFAWRAGFPGSSPRGRGKLPLALSLNHAQRLIPARAGKTKQVTLWGCGLWAHPRAGGENCKKKWGYSREQGSSPRGRGKLTACEPRHIWFGLIPARAGKTQVLARAVSAVAAHPRAGGENVLWFLKPR